MAAVLRRIEGGGFAGRGRAGRSSRCSSPPTTAPTSMRPWHFHPTMNRGERSWTIDEVPLEWCLQPGVKLDFRHLPGRLCGNRKGCRERAQAYRPHAIAARDRRRQQPAPEPKYGRQDYVNSGCGMGYEATMYLLERGVRLTGIDGWSWDAPFVYTAKKYAETRDASLIWEGHKARTPHRLPATSKSCTTSSNCRRPVSLCHVFPVKIERASAGWTRAGGHHRRVRPSGPTKSIPRRDPQATARRRAACRAPPLAVWRGARSLRVPFKIFLPQNTMRGFHLL